MANFLGMSTGGAGASNPSKGGKPTIDSRGPQEKGKPAATTSHQQAVGSGSAGDSATVPNRSGSVRMKSPQLQALPHHGKTQQQSEAGL